MKTEYKAGDIISYPVPGVCVGECDKNTVNKETRIIRTYDNISSDGVIVDMEVIDGSVKGILSGKLLHTKNYKVN